MILCDYALPTMLCCSLERGLRVCGPKRVPDEAPTSPQVILPVVQAPELPRSAAERKRERQRERERE